MVDAILSCCAWRVVSHGGVRGVLRRAGLGRRLARLAAAEALSAAEGGPLTERALREIRAIERPKVMHIGSEVVGAELFRRHDVRRLCPGSAPGATRATELLREDIGGDAPIGRLYERIWRGDDLARA